METPSGEQELTYWETVALTRWGRYLTEIERHAVMAASMLAGERGTAVEIGCEGGRWSKLLTDQGWDLICTDVSPDSLRLCQRRLPAARCIPVKPTDTSLPCATNTVNLL